MRRGMETLRGLSDEKLDRLFENLSGIEFGEEEFVALLQGNPRRVLRRVGLQRAGRVLLGLVEGWVRAGARRSVMGARPG